jgi:hypothetical protein
MSVILDEVKRIDEENPTGPDDEGDPRIGALLDEGNEIIQQLDPLMRSRHRHNPAKLAEWDEIVHMCDDLDEDASTEGGVSGVN